MQLAIDCASDEPGVALAVGGVAGQTLTWRTERNHASELLPNIERLLQEAERTKDDIDAVFVDVGPGGYAALRVGASTAKALAHALGAPLVGIGRLELDAWSVAAEAGGRRIVAVHRAGRGELAWAFYGSDGGWHEVSGPALLTPDALVGRLSSDDALTGEVDGALADAASKRGAVVLVPGRHRVVALTALGDARLRAGRTDDPTALVPLYLRAPAIGPQG